MSMDTGVLEKVAAMVRGNPVVMLANSRIPWDILSNAVPNADVFSIASGGMIGWMSARVRHVQPIRNLSLRTYPRGTVCIADTVIETKQVRINGEPLATEVMAIMAHANVSMLYLFLPREYLGNIEQTVGQVTAYNLNKKWVLVCKRTPGYEILPVDLPLPDPVIVIDQEARGYDPENMTCLWPTMVVQNSAVVSEMVNNPLASQLNPGALQCDVTWLLGRGIAAAAAFTRVGIRRAAAAFYDDIAAALGLSVASAKDTMFFSYGTSAMAAYRFLTVYHMSVMHQPLGTGVVTRKALMLAPELADPPLSSARLLWQLSYLAGLATDENVSVQATIVASAETKVTFRWPWTGQAWRATHEFHTKAEELAAAAALQSLARDCTLEGILSVLRRRMELTYYQIELEKQFPSEKDELIMVMVRVPDDPGCMELRWCTTYDSRIVYKGRHKTTDELIYHALGPSAKQWQHCALSKIQPH